MEATSGQVERSMVTPPRRERGAGIVAALLWIAGAAGAQDLPAIDSFLYQLQDLDPAAVAASGFDLVITDYSADGSAAGEWQAADVAQMRSGGRIALAYLSIGEAEDYRFYWDPSWRTSPPPWLGRENRQWPGNYEVRYWDPAWQSIILEYLDRIIAQGFDGVYLDIIDAYEYWGPADDGGNGENPGARQDMIDWVTTIAAHARATVPGFLVVPQNGAGLGADAAYLAAVSGIGAEDTWYNGNRRQRRDHTGAVVPELAVFRDAGKRVLVIDYTTRSRRRDAFYEVAEASGFVPHASVRDLDRLSTWLEHPAPPADPLVAASPADGALIDAGTAPEFSFTGVQPGDEVWLAVSGEPSFRRAVHLPSRRRPLEGVESFTPSRKQWRRILRQARRNEEGRVWWWLTRRTAGGARRASRARSFLVR